MNILFFILLLSDRFVDEHQSQLADFGIYYKFMSEICCNSTQINFDWISLYNNIKQPDGKP